MVPEAEKAVTGKYAQQVKPGRSQLMLLPDVAQLLIGNSRVDHRVRDRTMPHEGLQRAGVYPRDADQCRRLSSQSSVVMARVMVRG